MTRRAFDTCGNLADRLYRCLETPYSDVLKHHTVPATRWDGPRRFLRGPFSLFWALTERLRPGPLQVVGDHLDSPCHRRWAAKSKFRLIVVVFVFEFVFDFVLENIIIRTTHAYAYAKTYEPLTL